MRILGPIIQCGRLFIRQRVFSGLPYLSSVNLRQSHTVHSGFGLMSQARMTIGLRAAHLVALRAVPSGCALIPTARYRGIHGRKR